MGTRWTSPSFVKLPPRERVDQRSGRRPFEVSLKVAIRITRGGLTLPERLRKSMNLRGGDKLVFEVQPDRTVLVQAIRQSPRRVSGAVPNAKASPEWPHGLGLHEVRDSYRTVPYRRNVTLIRYVIPTWRWAESCTPRH